jgi:hypothetical protein
MENRRRAYQISIVQLGQVSDPRSMSPLQIGHGTMSSEPEGRLSRAGDSSRVISRRMASAQPDILD